MMKLVHEIWLGNYCALMMPLKSNQHLGQSRSTDAAPFSATDANKVEQHMMQSSKASDNLDISTNGCCNQTTSRMVFSPQNSPLWPSLSPLDGSLGISLHQLLDVFAARRCPMDCSNHCARMMPLKSNQLLGQSHSTDSAPFSATDANKVEQHMMQSSKASDNLDISTNGCMNMALNKKSEQGTLYDETSEKVSVTPNSKDNAATSSNPNPIPNPIAIPSPSPTLRRIKITEDLTLLLVPRVKLDFIVCCLGDSFGYLSESDLKDLVTAGFRNPRNFRKIFFVPFEDIHVHYLHPCKLTDDNLEVFAEGSIYIRDPSLKSMKSILKWQKILVEKMHSFQVKFMESPYQVRIYQPAFSEDPCEMMSAVSGLREDPPTIVLKGIPSEWFSDLPDSSEPSKKLLHIFLETFGKVRHLECVANHESGKDGSIKSKVSSTLYWTVLVQYEKYEDCENALRSLCAHSLQKDPSMVANYDVSWEEDLCQNARCHTNRKKVFREVASEGTLKGDQRGSADYAQVESAIEGLISGLQQQLEALKHLAKGLKAKDKRIAMLEEELEAFSS